MARFSSSTISFSREDKKSASSAPKELVAGRRGVSQKIQKTLNTGRIASAVYVGSRDHFLYALAPDGALRWLYAATLGLVVASTAHYVYQASERPPRRTGPA